MLNRNARFGGVDRRLFAPLLLALLCLQLAAPERSFAAQWVDASATVDWEVSNPLRGRRATSAKVYVTITNRATEVLKGPLRLVTTNLSPAGTELLNASGETAGGDEFVSLTPYFGTTLVPGASIERVELELSGFGNANFDFDLRLERSVPDEGEPPTMPTVTINEPETLITVGSSPITLSGTVADPDATLTVNGAPVANDQGRFAVDVALKEGLNNIIVRAVDAANQEAIGTVSVSLDKSPPYVTIRSHEDGAEVYSDRIAVSGLVNDIVRGTVSEGEANVLVNGVAASVSNRAYLARDVPLSEGDNLIRVTASDAVGNVGSTEIHIVYKPQVDKVIETVSGQGQTGTIFETLPEPLAIRLTENGLPAPDREVVFRVVQGDGLLAPGTALSGTGLVVATDGDGIARASFKLGSRAGEAMHRVRARAAGYDGEAVFHASAGYGDGTTVGVIAGNNQFGSVWQPLPNPFVLAVTDVGANLIEGAEIEFSVVSGGGRFENGEDSLTTRTDADGRASARYIMGPVEGADAQRVTATLVGTGASAGFTATAFEPGDPGNTRISGLVLDNQDMPLPGVTVRVEGTNREARSDINGQFRIESVPVGPLHLIADGSTATALGEWPSLSYDLVTVAGVENPLPSPIYLVALDLANAAYVGRKDKTLTLPEVPGFALEVAADSVTFPNGDREGYLSITPVNANRVPMPPPNGMQPQFIVTIQPHGARFDPPARLTLPNVDGHAPGAEVEMYSYDHDLEEFVTIGLGTVSGDGSVIQSNPGVGVIKAGWHCGSQPGGSGCCEGGGDCGYCYDAVGECPKDCQLVPERAAENQVQGNCQTELCQGSRDNNSDTPPEECGVCEDGRPVVDEDKPLDADKQKPDDCKELLCGGGFNPADETAEIQKKEGQQCKVCKDGDIENDADGRTCGDGTPQQACYTCKDGKCDNHCEADSATNTFEHTAPDYVLQALRGFKATLSSSPVFSAVCTEEIAVKLTVGEKCCKNCETPEPKSYREFGGSAGVKCDIKATIPYLGIVKDFPDGSFAGFTVKSSIFVTAAGASIAVNGGGEVAFLDIDCPGEDCGSFFIGAKIAGKFGPQLEAGVALVECHDPKCDQEGQDMTTLAEIKGTGNLTLNVSGSIGGKYASDAQCGSSCIGGWLDPVKGEAAFSVSFTFLFKKWTYADSKSVTVWDGGALGGGPCN